MPSGQAFGGDVYTVIALLSGLFFVWQAIQLYTKRDIESAKRLMYSSFIYLPVMQLALLFDFIVY
jgi:protoheme IX farnesyltransferase